MPDAEARHCTTVGAWDDAELERSLRRGRARRRRAAQIMVVALLIPLSIQALVVSTSVAVQFGLVAVVLPLVVVWIVRRGSA